ncbi:AraC family transcriptional regulator N-terminal domain-containing protein [Pseudomonas alliivorans]|nr:AraC family transcriptional regulator N-terminal domain-containing protein [Pseudomonas alliivorans]MEE4711756.1 AraC family transcriptional regulator N-terminal domain-containing protein [Pseudomonas alliivorans]MEE4726909.1 AraC family transcriptional regulator N-terminal domain-containing protein [Pseudomonas alliivorans]MEE4768192.1 AraC family transcriptional regulator N-terminal domain-containing protein [Pseudomonas alliivorans]
MGSLEKLIDIIRRHARTDGLHTTPVAGVSLVRSGAPTVPMPVVYEPTLCLIVQGRKQVAAGTLSYVYDASTYLVASVDMPVMGSVIEASEALPYLCLVLDLDITILSELALRHPAISEPSDLPTAGIELNATTPELLDAAARLAGLLDAPHDIEALAPLIIREMLYRLLSESGNGIVRQLARADSRLRQIAKAIAWMREHYRQGCRIDDIAELAGMSRSTRTSRQ